MSYIHRCDLCGKLIPICDFMRGATRKIVHRVTARNVYRGEEYEEICIECNKDPKNNEIDETAPEPSEAA